MPGYIPHKFAKYSNHTPLKNAIYQSFFGSPFAHFMTQIDQSINIFSLNYSTYKRTNQTQEGLEERVKTVQGVTKVHRKSCSKPKKNTITGKHWHAH